jgi:hypothetical protein
VRTQESGEKRKGRGTSEDETTTDWDFAIFQECLHTWSHLIITPPSGGGFTDDGQKWMPACQACSTWGHPMTFLRMDSPVSQAWNVTQRLFPMALTYFLKDLPLALWEYSNLWIYSKEWNTWLPLVVRVVRSYCL